MKTLNEDTLTQTLPQLKPEVARNANTKMTVFLVDDNSFYLNTLLYFLQNSLPGHVFFKTFTTGQQCLDAIHEKPDVVVLDYLLDSDAEENSNGLEVMKKINKYSPRTTVVILSGQTKNNVISDVLREGAYDYVSKDEKGMKKLKKILLAIFSELPQNRQMEKEAFFTQGVSFVLVLVLIIWVLLNLIT